MKRTISILLILLTLVLVACTPENKDPIKDPDVESIEFNMAATSLAPGEHTLIAVALPEGSNQQIQFTIQGIVDGISVAGNKLNIGNAVSDGTQFTVVATSVYDPTIRKTIVFTVVNAGEDAIEISTEAELRAIGTEAGGLSKSYKLMNDIELTQPWVPIGVAEVEEDDLTITPGIPFTGVFDGQGFTISGIDISSEEPLFNGGFFAQIGPTAVVKNAGFEGEVRASGWSGGIAGINEGQLDNVFSNIKVTVTGTSAGSLVSVNRGLIRYAYGIGKVVSETNTNDKGRSAGLVAANEGSMVEVYGDYQTLETPNYAAFSPSTNPSYMLPTIDMKTAATWSAFDEDVWYVADGTYPLLKHEGFEPPVIVPELGVAIKNTVLAVDVEDTKTLQINAEIVNAVGGEVLVYALKDAVDGVSMSQSGLVTFDENAVPANFTFTVVVTIKDTDVKAEKAFTGVYNPEIVDDVVYIETATELLNLLAGQKNPENLSKTFILKNDIELTSNWTAIGEAPNEDEAIVGVPFTGIFDGAGYKISGINMPGGGFNKGFFGYIGEDAVVKNTHFEGYIEANAWAGALAANNSGTIQDVIVDIEIYAYGGNAGAIVEHNHGLLKNIVVLGKAVSDSGGTNTGLVTTNHGQFENVFANTETVGTLNLVAFGAVLDNGTHIISDTAFKLAATYAAFDEDVWYVADGTHPLLKHDGFEPPVIVPELDVIIDNTVLEIDAEVTASLQIETTVLNSEGDEVLVFSLKEAVLGVSIDQDGVVTFNTELLAANFTFTVVVTIDGTEINAEKLFTGVYNPEISDDVVYIETAEQFMNLLSGQTNPENLSKTFVLKNDIVLTEAWVAIGIAPNEDEAIVGVPFTGIFDGAGYKISGINMPGGGFNKGFFGYIGEGAVVKNTHFEGNLEANGWSGALAANNSGTIQDVIVDIEVYAYGGNAGAIVEHNHGLLKNIIVLGKAVSDSGGSNTGLVTTNFGTIDNVFANIDTVGTLNLVAFGAVADDGSHIISAQAFILAATYAAFDEAVWYIADGTHPLLKHEGFEPPVVEPEDIIYITTEAGLRELANNPTEASMALTYILMNDIVLTEESESPGMYWTKSIGTELLPFMGTFDGNGFTISNVKNAYNTNANFGFFGHVGTSGVVQNLILDTNGVLHAGTNSAVFVQYNYGLIQNVMTFGEIENTVSTRYVSGFIRQNNGVIKNAIASVIISHDETAQVRGAFAASTNGTGSFENAIYNAEVAGSSQMEGVSTGLLKFYPSGSNNNYIVDYNTTYFETASNFEGWDTDIWLIVEGTHITLQSNITAS